MIPGLGTLRPLVVQQFLTRAVAVTTAATPIDTTLDKSRLITSFAISNPVGGTSVFLGNPGVTIAGGTNAGFEIPGGSAPNFVIDNQGRQLYELQDSLNQILAGLQCNIKPLDGIPFVVWDISTMFLVASAATTVTLIILPTMYL